MTLLDSTRAAQRAATPRHNGVLDQACQATVVEQHGTSRVQFGVAAGLVKPARREAPSPASSATHSSPVDVAVVTFVLLEVVASRPRRTSVRTGLERPRPIPAPSRTTELSSLPSSAAQAVFLALFFTTVGVIASTAYADVPAETRTLFVRDAKTASTSNSSPGRSSSESSCSLRGPCTTALTASPSPFSVRSLSSPFSLSSG